MKLPNLLIAGVSHGGTTSLFTYLSSHPEICASKTKETHYFYPTMIGDNLPPIQEYQKFFLHCKNQRYIMEAGPGYLYGGGKLACLIKELLGEVKLIFILRDPIAKLYSNYKYKNKSLQIENMSFHDFVQLSAERFHNPELSKEEIMNDPTALAINSGCYAKHLKEWYNWFNEESIKIVFFDDLRERPLYLIDTICQWLNIDVHLQAHNDFTIENRGFYYKNKSIHKLAISLNKKLEPFFRTYPSLKNTIKNIYMINTRENPYVLDDLTKDFLTKLYAPYNNELHLLLKSKGYHENVPDWLSSHNQ